MTLDQQPFRQYKDKAEKLDIISVRLNVKERAILESCKGVIMQERDSTALKILADIGSYVVLHDQLTHYLIGRLFKNKANNQRLGIPLDEPDLQQM